jgi:hypothetical protein
MAAPAATSTPATTSAGDVVPQPPPQTTWKKFKNVVRGGMDSIADSIEVLSPELKIQLHLDKLKKNY